MVQAPAQILEELFSALDRKDAGGIQALLGPDVVMVDEVSRRWLRGKDVVAAQISSVLAATSSVQSRLSGVQSQPLGGDAVLLTGWLDQTYSLQGTEQTISAPLSASLEVQDGAWRVVSLHAIPLAEAEPS